MYVVINLIRLFMIFYVHLRQSSWKQREWLKKGDENCESRTFGLGFNKQLTLVFNGI